MTTAYTPMVQQYLEVKRQHEDELLFFRLGDFYEMFFEDALTASRELNITLTGRAGGMEEKQQHAHLNRKLLSKEIAYQPCWQLEDDRCYVEQGLIKRDFRNRHSFLRKEK